MSLIKIRKVIVVCSCLFVSIILASCKQTSINRDTFFSEMYVGEIINDCALEVTSLSSTINKKINFYNGGEEIKYTYTFAEDFSLVVFLNKTSTLEKTDNYTQVILADDYICGNYYVEIVDEHNNVLDALGYKGFNLNYLRNSGLVRLKEFYEGDENFNELHYITIRKGITKYLGNNEAPLTLEELRYGPRLDTNLYSYASLGDENDQIDTGNYLKVKQINSLIDGDTSDFTLIGDTYSSRRIRYLLIDTPEISHGPSSLGQPFGQEAKQYNINKLRNATSIYVQSNRNKPLHETYSRTLGYVWYSNDSSIENLKLLNFELVYAGLAEFSYYDKYEDMYYKDITYYEYLRYAYNEAKTNKIKIHGEKDPTYSYI